MRNQKEIGVARFERMLWRKSENFEQAIEGIRKRFTEVDEIAKTVRERDEEIQEECRKLMARAISAVLEANRQQESGEVDYE